MCSGRGIESNTEILMSEQIRPIIRDTVEQMLITSTSAENIHRMMEKHRKKVHFTPIRYRVIGGILQGLNIKFGNFIESLLTDIIELDEGVEMMPDSGKRIQLFFTPDTNTLIDQYITSRQLPNSPDDCTPSFDNLLRKFVGIERVAAVHDRQGIINDQRERPALQDIPNHNHT